MKTYYGAVVGYGGMGRQHVTRILETDRIRYIGAYDVDPARVELALADGLERVYPSLEALLADGDLDFVLCATPNNFHKDISIAALRAGKAVICEKPVTMSGEELAEIMAVQKETGCVFTVHQNRRMDRDFLIVKEAIQNGGLGNVFEVESRVTGSRGIPEGWRQYAVAGGGMMLDWGVHLIDQAVQLFEEETITSVYCTLYHVAYTACDDGFRLELKTDKGRHIMIEVGTSHYITAPRWYVFGDRGAVTVENWDCAGEIVRAVDRQVTFEEEIIYTKAGPTRTMGPRARDTVAVTRLDPADYAPSDYDSYYRRFADTLDGTAPLWVKPEQAMRVMRIMEAAFESDKTGQVIRTAL